MRCAKHPDMETYVRCAQCDTPICGDCMVTGPVGIRCPGCAHGKAAASPVFQPKPTSIARGAGLGVVTAGLFGWVALLPTLLLVLGSAGLGCLVGEVVLRAGGRKRGKLMETIAGATALLGFLAWRIPWIQILLKGFFGIPWHPMWYVMTIAGAVLVVVCAVGRIRYL